jgi:PAS domain S-box-containing protein
LPNLPAELTTLDMTAVLDRLDTYVFAKDVHGRYVYINRAAAQLFDLLPREVLGRTSADFFDTTKAADIRLHEDEALQGSEPIRREERVVLVHTGEVRTIWTTRQPVFDAAGQLVGLTGFSTDITEDKRRQHQVEALEKRLQATLDALPDLLFEIDGDGRFMDYRSPRRELLVVPPEAFLGRAVEEVLPPDVAKASRAALEEARSTGFSVGTQYNLLLPNGNRRFELSVARKAQVEGESLRFMVLARDITDRHLAESALRESRALLRTVLDEIPDPIVLKDHKGDFLLGNLAVAKLYGTTPDELVGKHDGDFGVPAELADAFRRNVLEIMAKGQTEVVAEPSRDAMTGETRHYRSIKKPLKDSDGYNRILVVAHDVTDLVHAQEQVADRERQLQDVLNATREGIWDWHIPSGRVQHNDQWYRIAGITEDERDDSLESFDNLLHPEDRSRVGERIAACLHNRAETYYSEHRLRRSDGTTVWVQDRGRIVERDAEGAPLRMVGSCADISERKRAEVELDAYRRGLEQLVEERTAELAAAKQSAEAASLAKSAFLANLSHEIRAPLNSIGGLVSMIRRLGLTPLQMDRLGKLDVEAQRLVELVNSMLDLSKIEAGRFELERAEVQIDAVIAHVVATVEARLRSPKVQVVTDVQRLPKPLLGDATRIMQVLMHLGLNAAKATDTGTITLRVRADQMLADGVLVRFEVIDTGKGVPPEVMPQLFSAFERQQADDPAGAGGAGLGLAIAKKVAVLMGGDAGAESELGRGSTFWFTAMLAQARVMTREVSRAYLGLEPEPPETSSPFSRFRQRT